MPSLRAVPAPARDILELARRDRGSARAALDALSPQERVDVVCGAPLARRAEMLALASRPEEVIPLLPEAELCFIVKSIGVEDAPWILESATPEQLVACIDLDAWSGLALAPEKLDAWLAALLDAGEKPLLTAVRNLDPELLVRMLMERAQIVMKPPGDEGEGWDPPDGARTVEGQFYFAARREGDDLASLASTLDILFREDYWLYFRLMQGAIWEIESDLEEWSLRWRIGRLEDLGFPGWDEAMRIYGYVRPDRRAELPEPAEAAISAPSDWRLPVWIPGLPVPLDGSESRFSVFRAASKLAAEDRSAFFYAFVSLANSVAVADRMALGDAETLPAAIEKAATHASRGLDHVVEKTGVDASEALRRAGPTRLFRVGASIARDEASGA